MKITLKLNDEQSPHTRLIITNDKLAQGWVQIEVSRSENTLNEVAGAVRLSELMPALIAFDAQHARTGTSETTCVCGDPDADDVTHFKERPCVIGTVV
jgi:hypothetical protein